MTRIFNEDLLGDLARQRVVLFLGAGVSASATTVSGNRIAGWPQFLENCIKLTADPLKTQLTALLASKDYLLTCELLQQNFKEEWGALISKEFGQRATPSSLHASLLSLNQRIIVTTNFDKLIETTWSNNSPASHYPSVISSIDQNIFRILKDHEGSYILKIHGTVDDANSLIFSRSEYIKMAFGNYNYSTFLESLLLNYTFLYVGFSMDDPAITSLMEMYALRYPKSRPHYIFSPNHIEENIIDIHKRLRKLVVIPYNKENNHSELSLIISDMAEQSKKRSRMMIGELIG